MIAVDSPPPTFLSFDVRDRAIAVLAKLKDGSMPCDGGWPPERIAMFRQ